MAHKFFMRKTEEADRAMLEAWILGEPAHAGVMPVNIFLPAEKPPEKKPGLATDGTEVILFGDREGAGACVRIVNAVRLQLLTPPEQNMHVARIVHGGLPWLLDQLRERNYRQAVFDSKSPRLVKVMDRYGFRPREDEYVAEL